MSSGNLPRRPTRRFTALAMTVLAGAALIPGCVYSEPPYNPPVQSGNPAPVYNPGGAPPPVYTRAPTYPPPQGYVPPPTYAPPQAYAPPQPVYPAPALAPVALLGPEQIDQLTAPVALYPDPLVAQILPAATYPDQVVAAAGWVRANPNGLPEDWVNAQPWDESVKALVHYPTVITMLADRAPWTQQLGTAYLNQGGDVMTSIQRLRAQAQVAGSLYSTPQQTVVVEEGEICVRPVREDVIFVPEYDPTIVYVRHVGPPRDYIRFGPAYHGGVWLDKDADWRHHDVVVYDRHDGGHDAVNRGPARDGGHPWTRKPEAGRDQHSGDQRAVDQRPGNQRPAVPDRRGGDVPRATAPQPSRQPGLQKQPNNPPAEREPARHEPAPQTPPQGDPAQQHAPQRDRGNAQPANDPRERGSQREPAPQRDPAPQHSAAAKDDPHNDRKGTDDHNRGDSAGNAREQKHPDAPHPAAPPPPPASGGNGDNARGNRGDSNDHGGQNDNQDKNRNGR